MTKAQEIQQRVDVLMAEGKPRAEAFKELAAELGIKYDSVRGAYYTAANAAGGEGGSGGRTTRPRRRETTPEADALKRSSAARKAEITRRLEALS